MVGWVSVTPNPRRLRADAAARAAGGLPALLLGRPDDDLPQDRQLAHLPEVSARGARPERGTPPATGSTGMRRPPLPAAGAPAMEACAYLCVGVKAECGCHLWLPTRAFPEGCMTWPPPCAGIYVLCISPGFTLSTKPCMGTPQVCFAAALVDCFYV